MAAAPVYASNPVGFLVQAATANTARDGSGTLATIVPTTTTATRVDDITITAAATTTAGVIRMFISDGTSTKLLDEYLVTAVTPSTTVAVWSIKLVNLAIIIPVGWSLKFSTEKTETFNIATTRAATF